MEIKAKTTSLIGMIIGAVFSAVCFGIVMYKFITVPTFNMTFEMAGALIVTSLSPAIPFCPVFINMFFDKIKEIKSLKAGGTASETK